MLTLRTAVERWPIAGSFTISRGSRTEAVVVVAELGDGRHVGRGECVPYARYGETVESVVAAIEAARPATADRDALQHALPPGAARNALDCALWDLAAKSSGRPAAETAGVPQMRRLQTCYTLSLVSPAEMAAAARAAGRPILKLKLGGDGDVERVQAVRAAAPEARLVVDANEAWSGENFHRNMQACATAGVALVEQPLPAGKDDLLASFPHLVPVCADESVHALADLGAIAGKYDAVNVKLDKAGGLTEALALSREARRRGLSVMVGCMIGTSLAMAPAMIVAQEADLTDLDGPLLLARDRSPGLVYSDSWVEPPSPRLWG